MTIRVFVTAKAVPENSIDPVEETMQMINTAAAIEGEVGRPIEKKIKPTRN